MPSAPTTHAQDVPIQAGKILQAVIAKVCARASYRILCCEIPSSGCVCRHTVVRLYLHIGCGPLCLQERLAWLGRNSALSWVLARPARFRVAHRSVKPPNVTRFAPSAGHPQDHDVAAVRRGGLQHIRPQGPGAPLAEVRLIDPAPTFRRVPRPNSRTCSIRRAASSPGAPRQ